MPDLQPALRQLGLGLVGSVLLILALARILPATPVYRNLVSQGASGATADAVLEQRHGSETGREGIAITPLTPGGRARFGEDLLDVITRGERIDRGRPVRIIAHSGPTAVVEEVT